MELSRALLQRLVRTLARIYFREIRVLGAAPAASTGRRLFAANHVNGLVDPLLVLAACPCPMAPVAKATLFHMPVLRWLLRAADAVPVVRRKDTEGGDVEANRAANRKAFERIVTHFADGKNVLIFPEGVSHNEAHVLPLKTGAARMLATAAAANVAGLTYQAVGLEFDAKDTFRSRAVLVFGEPRAVPVGVDEATFVRTVTDTLARDLASLVVLGETHEQRRRVMDVAELYVDDAQGDFGSLVDVALAVSRARSALAGDAALVRDVERAVDHYFGKLRAARLRDAQVARGSLPSPAFARGQRRRLVAVAPLALIGAALYALPYRVPRWVAARLANEADVRSTWKLAAGVLVFPAWAALLLVVWALAAPPELRASGWSLLVTLVVLLSPFACLVWLDALDASPPSSSLASAHLAALRAEREALVARLEAARTKTKVTAATVAQN